MNRSVPFARRKSTRKSKSKQSASIVQLSHLSTLPNGIKSIITSMNDLNYSKLKELEFLSQSPFSDNILLMKSAVQAQQISIQSVIPEATFKMLNFPKQNEIKSEFRYEKSSQRSRSRRRQSQDIFADSKQLQVFNPFHFEEKGDQDFFLVQ